MQYALFVLTPPDAGASALHALGFAQALLAAEHDIACVFFYDQAVLTALSNTDSPQDELDIAKGWETLSSDHGIALYACVASAARHGLEGNDSTRVRQGFAIAGLGELVAASASCDRLLTFAA